MQKQTAIAPQEKQLSTAAWLGLATQELDLLPYPVLVTNAERIITHRNPCVNTRELPLRRGASIDRYLSRVDRRKISELAVGEETFVDVRMPNAYGALVLRTVDGYYLALRNVTAHMLQYVQQLTDQTMLFYGQFDRQILAAQEKQAEQQAELDVMHRVYRRTLRSQVKLATYFRVTAGRKELTEFGELLAPVRSLLTAAEELLRAGGIRLATSQDVETKSQYVGTNAQDVRYALMTMLSIALEGRASDRIMADYRRADGDFTVMISFEPTYEREIVDRILSGYYRGAELGSFYGHTFFDLLLLQLLAEANGWRFSVTESGCNGGVLDMVLSIPLRSDRPPLSLHQPQDDESFLRLFLFDKIETAFD